MIPIEKDSPDSPPVTAVEANFIAQLCEVGQPPHGKVRRERDIVWVISQMQSPWLNYVLSADFTGGAIDKKIDEALDHFRERGVPMTWWIGPSSRPHDLGEALIRHGLTAAGRMSAMVLDLKSTTQGEGKIPEDFEVIRVCETAELESYLRVFSQGFAIGDELMEGLKQAFFEMSFAEGNPQRHFLGLYKGLPVGTSSLRVDKGVAGVYHVATIPDARGMGIGSAMTRVALDEAREVGYRHVVLQASQDVAEFYSKMGFKRHFDIEQFMWNVQARRGLIQRLGLSRHLARMRGWGCSQA